MESVKKFLQNKESINTLINDYLLNADYHSMNDCKNPADVISNVAEDYGGKRGYEIINSLLDKEEYEWVFVRLEEMYKRSFMKDFNKYLDSDVTPKDPKNVYGAAFYLMDYVDDEDMLKYFDEHFCNLKILAELYKDEELCINIRYKDTIGDLSRYTISLNKFRDNVITCDKLTINEHQLYNLIIKAVQYRYTNHMCTIKYGPDYNKMYR